jgi:hypothetical protein
LGLEIPVLTARRAVMAVLVHLYCCCLVMLLDWK